MSTPPISIVTMDQRMALFRDAMRVSQASCPAGTDRTDHVITVFGKFLDAIVRGLPLPADLDTGNGLTIIEEFLADRCVLDPGLKAQAGPLYSAFVGWMRGAYPENEPPSQTAFGTEMRRRFPKKLSNVVYFLGVGLQGGPAPETTAHTSPARHRRNRVNGSFTS